VSGVGWGRRFGLQPRPGSRSAHRRRNLRRAAPSISRVRNLFFFSFFSFFLLSAPPGPSHRDDDIESCSSDRSDTGTHHGLATKRHRRGGHSAVPAHQGLGQVFKGSHWVRTSVKPFPTDLLTRRDTCNGLDTQRTIDCPDWFTILQVLGKTQRNRTRDAPQTEPAFTDGSGAK
jgi:hypothetical protein